MDFPDEFLFDTRESRLTFIDMLRKARPDVVFCHFEKDYHIDHRISGQLAESVAVMLTVPNIETEHPPASKIPAVYFMDTVAGLNFGPEEYVDISDTFETKKEMLSKHKSQAGWLEDQYGISYLDFMEITAKFRGIQMGVKYAEGFRKAVAWPREGTRNILP